MNFPNLSSFLHALRQRRQLVEIDSEVDPKLELAEIHRRVIAAGGPALLFKRIRGKRFPVVTNLFGTKERVELAFGQRPKDFIAKAARLPEELLPPSLAKLWGLRHMGLDALRIGFKSNKHAPVLKNQIPGADLTALPALTSWSEDGGPFLTLPLVHTQLGPTSSTHARKPDNLGMYRIQIYDRQETGMHFQIGKGGGYHLYEAEQRNENLPVNIYLGGPPALILSAIAPLPENVPELLLASLVLGERLPRGKLPDPLQPAPIAEAEFCLAGHVPPHIRRPEGPFGDHYGYYSLVHDFPVFRPQAIYHRDNAIFPATVVGKPRQEDFFIGDYLQELLSPLFPVVMPAVKDLWSYGETGYHSLAAAVLKERYGREALSSCFRILGEGQLTLTKFLLGVDQEMDLRDFRKVLTHILERVDWRSDLCIFAETSMDTLDYTGRQLNKGSKGVLLGLGAAKRQLPREISGTKAAHLPNSLVRDARVFVPGCLVVEVAPFTDAPELMLELAQRPELSDWQMIVAVDDARKTCQSEASFLWTTFTRFDPAMDIYSAGTRLAHNKISYAAPVVIDARMKPWYPGELFCDPDTAKLVTQRWSEYFPQGGVTMGQSDYGHLI